MSKSLGAEESNDIRGEKKSSSSSYSYSSSERSDFLTAQDTDNEEYAQFTSIQKRVPGNMKWGLEDEYEDEYEDD